MKYTILLIFFANLVQAEEIIPEKYMEFSLLSSRFESVLEKFGEAKFQRIPNGHHEKGVCYKAREGHFIIFSTDLMSGEEYLAGISVRNNSNGMDCTAISASLPSCIGSYCIGLSKGSLASNLEKFFQKTTDDEGYVAGNDSKRAMTEAEKSRVNIAMAGGQDYFDVSNTIWLNFADDSVSEIAIYKVESF